MSVEVHEAPAPMPAMGPPRIEGPHARSCLFACPTNLEGAAVKRDVDIGRESQHSTSTESKMRKALVIGIDHYMHATSLFGCVTDAHAMKHMLERNADGTVNFDVKLLVGTCATASVRRKDVRDAIRGLFSTSNEIALLY